MGKLYLRIKLNNIQNIKYPFHEKEMGSLYYFISIEAKNIFKQEIKISFFNYNTEKLNNLEHDVDLYNKKQHSFCFGGYYKNDPGSLYFIKDIVKNKSTSLTIKNKNKEHLIDVLKLIICDMKKRMKYKTKKRNTHLFH